MGLRWPQGFRSSIDGSAAFPPPPLVGGAGRIVSSDDDCLTFSSSVAVVAVAAAVATADPDASGTMGSELTGSEILLPLAVRE